MVYITIDCDAKGALAVDKVFESYIDAENYVIDFIFINDEFYSGRTDEFKVSAAKNYIVVREIN